MAGEISSQDNFRTIKGPEAELPAFFCSAAENNGDLGAEVNGIAIQKRVAGRSGGHQGRHEHAACGVGR